MSDSEVKEDGVGRRQFQRASGSGTCDFGLRSSQGDLDPDLL